MSKHTAGPWKLQTVSIESRGGSNTCHKIGPFHACIYDDWRPREAGISEEENLANARLIAAAPELLTACYSLLACCGAGDKTAENAARTQAMAAIAKATGSEPAPPRL